MGKYFNPPQELKTVGRELRGAFSIQGLKSQLKSGEILVGLFGNGSFWTAPVLEDQQTLNHFEGQSIESSFYALDQSLAGQYIS